MRLRVHVMSMVDGPPGLFNLVPGFLSYVRSGSVGSMLHQDGNREATTLVLSWAVAQENHVAMQTKTFTSN